MKIKKYLLYIAFFGLASCGGKDQKTNTEEAPKQVALSKSRNSVAFNESFNKLMEDYFHLKDNFITESLPAIDIYANNMQKAAENLKLTELKGDTAIIETAKSFTASISSELKGMVGEKELKGKRKSFNMLTDQLYNLLRTVQYDREIIYHQHCPMAFEEGDANAYWLSRNNDIKNPYLPKTMLTCGDVSDSLDYRLR